MSITVKTAIVQGVAWMYETQQPEGALLPAQGFVIPVPDEQRTVSLHPLGAHDRPVIVVAHTDPEQSLRRNEIKTLATWCQRMRISVRNVWEHHPCHGGTVELGKRSHPTLAQASRAYGDGCPEHGYRTDPACDWYTRGYALLRTPSLPTLEDCTA